MTCHKCKGNPGANIATSTAFFLEYAFVHIPKTKNYTILYSILFAMEKLTHFRAKSVSCREPGLSCTHIPLGRWRAPLSSEGQPGWILLPICACLWPPPFLQRSATSVCGCLHVLAEAEPKVWKTSKPPRQS